MPLFSSLVSLFVAVAASAVLAVASVADVNAIELAVHSVLIEFAVGHTAGNAAIDILCHVNPPCPYYWQFLKKYSKGLTNAAFFDTIK